MQRSMINSPSKPMTEQDIIAVFEKLRLTTEQERQAVLVHAPKLNEPTCEVILTTNPSGPTQTRS